MAALTQIGLKLMLAAKPIPTELFQFVTFANSKQQTAFNPWPPTFSINYHRARGKHNLLLLGSRQP